MSGLTLTVTAAESHRIGANGESLEQAIRAHIGRSMEDYGTRKAAWNRDVGFETESGHLSFTVSQESLHGVSLVEYLVDLALGMREPLTIQSASMKDVRFGIAASRPLVELPEGVLDLMPEPVGKVEVGLKCGTACAWRMMDLFCPVGLAAVMEPSDLKYRLTSRFMEFMIRDSTLSFSLTVPEFNAQENLRELRELASMVLLFEESAGSRERMDFTLTLEGRILLQAGLEIPARLPPELVELATVIRDVWKVAKHLDIHDRVNMSLAELISQKEQLTTFLSLIEPARGAITVRFSNDRVIRTRGRQVCLPIGMRVSLGNFQGTLVSSLWGRLKRTDIEIGDEIGYELVRPQHRIERSFASRDSEPTPTLAELVHAVADAYDSVECLILPQYAMG